MSLVSGIEFDGKYVRKLFRPLHTGFWKKMFKKWMSGISKEIASGEFD